VAASEAGRLLTEAHRLAQGRISAETAARLLVLWRLIDPDNLAATAPAWVEAAHAVIAAQHAASANLATEYYRRFRTAEIGLALDDFTPAPPQALDPRQVYISLTAEGPARLRRAVEAGQDLTEAAQKAAAASAGAGARIALNGGSDVIVASTAADPRAYGVRRVTSPGCCAFCAMLASRSVNGLSADFMRPHLACACEPETAFTTGPQQATEQARAFNQLYQEAQSDRIPGTKNASYNAFRRALEAQRRGD
jgi:hypothetical protein